MSRGKQLFDGWGEVALVAGQTSLPFPPVFVGDVTALWHGGGRKLAPPEFDIEIWSAAAVNLTDTELFGVAQVQAQIASDDVDTVDFANNELDIAAHGLKNGMGPLQLTTTGTLPTGLSPLTDYWVIYVNTGTIQLAASLEDALEGTAVAFSDAGSGTHSILGSLDGDPEGDGSSFLQGSNNSYEIRWLSYGLLGNAADGAISLSAEEGYTVRVLHRPRTVAYALVATLSAAIAVSSSIYPVMDG